ncbi:biotin-protein ligase [Stachybotrys elegans]|uniref:Biotin-protein ligase n=1 Tax=Stachybotrys elegans TaxID=80388 RepID=A0A8K0WPT6_9HYPO|nr:biotin-protein ligase [Stachybotrys elegans]
MLANPSFRNSSPSFGRFPLSSLCCRCACPTHPARRRRPWRSWQASCAPPWNALGRWAQAWSTELPLCVSDFTRGLKLAVVLSKGETNDTIPIIISSTLPSSFYLSPQPLPPSSFHTSTTTFFSSFFPVMATRKLNVLVYTGTGATSESIRHCIYSLRRMLASNYAVIPVTETIILKEPWPATCALLVFPGGGDLGYCRALNGEGNRRITDFVRQGGAYLGLCAGAYYGSRRCEFEVGNRPLEVIGPRELAFFPGTCRGCAFGGFEYHSEKGARAVRLNVVKEAFPDTALDNTVSYYNGGGVFVDAAKFKDNNAVQVLATYDEDINVDGGDGKAAVVQCKVGSGKAILTGPHPEFAPVNLHPQPGIPDYQQLVQRLALAEKSRNRFFKACLSKLGLEMDDGDSATPPLSSLHLTSIDGAGVSELLYKLEEVKDTVDGSDFMIHDADKFIIKTAPDGWDMGELLKALAPLCESEGIIEYETIVKKIIAHENELPSAELTPSFDHNRFYTNLKRYQMQEEDAEDWGTVLMYGDVVTSTNTLLEKNHKLLSQLPSGFTLTASMQLAGRGRGSNVWLAPPGSLLFSTIIDHPAHLAASRPIVFIQYLAAIAIIEGIHSYGPGYEKLPIKLKWPNDIYALDPTKPASSASYIKIGGILSQCGYYEGAYKIVLGIGINTINPRPTTSISDLLPEGAAPLRIETLLARILTRLEAIHAQFRREGFSEDLEARYYRNWLHTGQSITLEEEAGAKARVLGITRDWGMLRVEQVDREGRGTGRIWTLQSDENSFDYWKGLIRKKT